MAAPETRPDGCVEACPACPHRGLSMKQSLEQKAGWLRTRLAPYITVLEEVRSVAEDQRLGYRNKVCLHAEYSGAAWKIGVRKRGEVVPIPDCPVHAPGINAAVRSLLTMLPAYGKFPLVYYVHSGAQLALVLKSAKNPDQAVIQRLLDGFAGMKEIEGLCLHFFPSAGKKVFGKGGWQLLYGSPSSVDESGLHYGPAAFQQLLPSLYKQAVDEAEGFFQFNSNDMLIDLYSGTGSSIRRWVSTKAKCIGVEISGDAIRCAGVNVPGIEVLRGTCSQRIPQLSKFVADNRQEGSDKFLYANPPRTGLEREVLDWIINFYQPQRLVYLSCSAGTLRRDLDELSRGNYHVTRLIPFDFFPNTRHVEVLSMLERS
ncbi:MAG: hypothetical protein AB9842_07010 [Bacteroidales bacterium]